MWNDLGGGNELFRATLYMWYLQYCCAQCDCIDQGLKECFLKVNDDLSQVLIFQHVIINVYSRGARDSKIGKKWPESSRILDYILS